MKIIGQKRRRLVQEFSGRVEIAITGIDTQGKRMNLRSGPYRRSIRIDETTVDEVYEIVYVAIEVNNDLSP